jgi:hypothetical protein
MQQAKVGLAVRLLMRALRGRVRAAQGVYLQWIRLTDGHAGVTRRSAIEREDEVVVMVRKYSEKNR